MQLKPGQATEYQRRHDALWPELRRELKKAGLSDYSIFLEPGSLTLFAVQKRAEPDRSDGLTTHPVMRRWWDYMADLMEVNPDNSPRCVPLQEVFHMD